MARKSYEDRLLESSLITGSLLALIAAVFWWVSRRLGRNKPAEQRPVIWRRDIEMGPARSESIQQAPEAAGELVEEVIIEAVPDVRAGDGGLSDEGTVEVESEEAPVEGPIPVETAPEEETPAGDDLEIIEGVGPKINTILQAAGIRTFAQLADTDIARLEEILHEAGIRRITNPATWPEQARLAANADWSGLENLQQHLKAGRR